MAKDDLQDEWEEVGRILKAHRESNGDTQAEIAKTLGYRNVNFITMIEKGKSNIPLGKTLTVLKAYNVDPDFCLPLIKKLHPEFWEIFIYAYERLQEVRVRKGGGDPMNYMLDEKSINKLADGFYFQTMNDRGLSVMDGFERKPRD